MNRNINNEHQSTKKKETFLRLKDVINRTGLTKGSIYNHMKKGLFPHNISLSSKIVVWLESEIDAWMTKQINDNRKKGDKTL